MSKFIIEKQVKGAIAENLAKNYLEFLDFDFFLSYFQKGLFRYMDVTLINPYHNIVKS